ncbi:hypothetical protein GCM10018954_051710 [Kutzneria kofuensis]
MATDDLVVPEAAGAQYRETMPSFAQERFWFLDGLVPGNAAHTLQQSYTIVGPLDVTALADALTAVVRRHDVLRSRYVPAEDEVRVQVDAPRPVDLPVLDLSTEPDPERRATEAVVEDAFTPFDLVTGPLFRARLLRTAADRHVLVLAAHRSVFDEDSFAIVERELAAGYQRARSGGPAPDPLPLSYEDITARQRATGPDDAGMAYWLGHLDEAPPAVDLPVDLPRPPIPSYRAGVVPFDLAEETVAALRGSAAPAEAVGLAAFATVLGRYSRADEVVVGMRWPGRPGPELADVVGSLAGHLPTRVTLAADMPIGGLAAQVEDALRVGRAHADVPFDRMATELAGDRDLSRHPVFQVSFDCAAPPADPVLPGLAVARRPPAAGWSRVDLELHLVSTPDGVLGGRFVYAEDLFDEATIRRLADHYVALLAAFATEPGTTVSEVDFMAPQERRLVFEDWNPVDPGLLVDRTVTELFEEQVRRTPDDVAVTFGADRLTYAELNGRANQLAGYLADQGVGPEVVVGLCLRRGLPLMIAVLAVLKAGGAYLPLDPDSPPARNEYLVTDARAGLVLTQADLRADLPAVPDVRYVVLAELADEVAGRPAADRPQPAGPDSMIYVIYTSGSTGRPKGVVMTHRPLVNMLGWQLRRTPVTGPTLQFSSIGFDISFEEMFATWLVGGELVLLSEEERRDPERMLAVMCAAGVRRLYCPPMVLEQLAHVAGDVLPPLAEIITAGEALHLTPEVRRLLARLDGVALDNQYGPTEAHVITGYRMTGPSESWPTHPPVGSAVTNARVYVLDEHRRPVPIGGSGEVCVGGVCLAREYLGRPDLTEDRFVPDPYSAEPGARMYRTGDLARWRPDGTLVFLGRVDEQVKIRGYRVEPGEIETVLATHPGVADSAVLPVQRNADRKLAAYVVLAAGAQVGAAELRTHLKRTLPEYMVPTYFTEVPEIPLTAVGKIDRKRLPDPVAARPEPAGDRAPVTGRAEALARIWEEVIGVDRVGPDDNFFDIGGHSLLATKVIARIREELAVQVSIRTLFEHSTVSTLAAALAELAPEEPTDPAAVVRRADRRHAPLSPIQHGMWLLHRIHPDCVAYHMPICFELAGELDTDALDHALTLLVERHEAMRTSFTLKEDVPLQRFSEPAEVRFTVVDLRDVPAGEQDEALRSQLAATVRTPFDLAAAPLWRAVRYVLGPGRQVILLVVHHIITDGWSMEIVKRELSLAYEAVRQGREPSWPASPVQFGDLAVREDAPAARERLARELEFWRTRLDVACPPLRLPTRIRSHVTGFDGDVVRGRLDTDTTRAVREIARSANASPFSVLLSAFALVLARCSGQSKFHVGAPLTVRDAPGADDAVGFFTNTMVLPCDTAGGSFLDLVGRTQQQVVDALAHPHVPFEALVSELAPRRQGQRNPLFDVWFNMLSFARHELSLPDVRVRELRPPLAGALFDLGAYVWDDGGDVEIELVYRPVVFAADRVEALLRQFIDVLRQVCAAPAAPVDEVRLAADRVPRREFAATPAASVWDRVRAIAASRPDKRAIESASTVSYRELAAQSEKLGQTLTRSGAGPGTVVALAARRTPDLVRGMVGALSAGAAFGVLDMSMPLARLTAQLAQLRPRVLLCPPGTAPELVDAARAGGAVVLGADESSTVDAVSDVGVVPEDTAYVSFTSGTTGRPLGVLGRQGPLTAFFDCTLRGSGCASTIGSPCWPACRTTRCSARCCCRCGSAPRSTMPDTAALATPEATVRWLARSGVHCGAPDPRTGRLLAAAARSAGLVVPPVRFVGLSGAAVSAADHARPADAVPPGAADQPVRHDRDPAGRQRRRPRHGVRRRRPALRAAPRRRQPERGAGRARRRVAVRGVQPDRRGGCAQPAPGVGLPHDPGLTSARFVPDPDGVSRRPGLPHRGRRAVSARRNGGVPRPGRRPAVGRRRAGGTGRDRAGGAGAPGGGRLRRAGTRGTPGPGRAAVPAGAAGRAGEPPGAAAQPGDGAGHGGVQRGDPVDRQRKGGPRPGRRRAARAPAGRCRHARRAVRA